jgi:prefoldin alpha subunit
VVYIGKQILVPLTASLYVPGTLKDADNVIVDVGTGFYVEKVAGTFDLLTCGMGVLTGET